MGDAGFALAVEQAVRDGNSVISISWGGPEYASSASDPLNAALKLAFDAGCTVCVATGDDGATDGVSDGKAHCDYPASSPLVLACGGTELVKNSTGTTEEIVWNSTGATGGGVSVAFELPSWQADAAIKIPSVNPPGTEVGRVVPDVAGLAAGGDWLIFEGGQGHGEGGTSAVAPLWAALLVLVNEKRAANCKGPVGFVNQAMYEKARVEQSALFLDVVKGNNRFPGPADPGYDAQRGFDACTGWGVPDGEAISNFLSEL